MFREKLLAFALLQQIARAGFDEHAETSLRLDQLLVDQFLIALQNRERIDPILGRNIAHGRQRIPFFEHAVEYHGDDTVTKLAVNRLTVIPFTIHSVFHINHCASYSDIVNYNTHAHASLFSFFFARRSRRHPVSLPTGSRHRWQRLSSYPPSGASPRLGRWGTPFGPSLDLDAHKPPATLRRSIAEAIRL